MKCRNSDSDSEYFLGESNRSDLTACIIPCRNAETRSVPDSGPPFERPSLAIGSERPHTAKSQLRGMGVSPMLGSRAGRLAGRPCHALPLFLNLTVL